jgi:Domain of unknown function (DUF4331)
MGRKAVLVVIAVAAVAVALAAGLVRGAGPQSANAASHREAPLIALTPAQDLSDVFFFRSYEPGNSDKVDLIMNVNPMSEPSAGPNYYNFDPNAVYAFNLDTNQDGQTDIRFEFRFQNEIRGNVRDLGLPLSYVAIPPITALDGKGSEGLGLRQRYSVRMLTRPDLPNQRPIIGNDLIAVPSNVGPLTMPNYNALAQQGIYSSTNGGLPNGVRVFAGAREDPFYIDLGGAFDTLNFSRTPPLLTAPEDANDSQNAFGVDMLSGFNVSTIALEVPVSMINPTGTNGKIGLYAEVDEASNSVAAFRDSRGRPSEVQTNRLANPLVNELVIGTIDKDRWNTLEPSDDGQFAGYALSPRFATALELRFGVDSGCVPLLLDPSQVASCNKNNRIDLANVVAKYSPTAALTGDWLRLDPSVAPTPLAQQKRLGILAHDASGNPTPDPAGWPNGRRPKDDVTDIATRVVGGPNYIAARAGDGVNTNDVQLPDTFPFLATPFDGRNRVHLNRTGP